MIACPAETRPIVITVERLWDDDPDLSWLDQTDDQMGDGFEDAARERTEGYRRGDWHMIGIRAYADVYVNGVRQRLTSAGLWGIESDSDEDYLRSIEEEERDELAEIIRAINPDAVIEEA